MGKRLGRLMWVVALAIVLRACVLEPVRMTDDSMTPVLYDSEVALVSKLVYGLRVPGAGSMLLEWSTPQKGDLVVSVAVGDPPVTVLRRIAAVPGDKVTMPNGKEGTLKPGEYFLAAEQKEGVMDSRKMGPVPRKSIIGKATYIWLTKRPSSVEGTRVESSQSDWRILLPL